VIDLLDPAVVARSQASKNRELVCGVVIDVHRRISVETLDEVVDTCLEGDLLVCGVVGPPGSELVVCVRYAPQILET